MDDSSDITHTETFASSLGGELIYCTSLADAVAIKNANHVICQHADYQFGVRDLDAMADVLDRYDRPEASETMRRLSSRMRAADFLAHSVGYRPAQRPAPS